MALTRTQPPVLGQIGPVVVRNRCGGSSFPREEGPGSSKYLRGADDGVKRPWVGQNIGAVPKKCAIWSAPAAVPRQWFAASARRIWIRCMTAVLTSQPQDARTDFGFPARNCRWSSQRWNWLKAKNRSLATRCIFGAATARFEEGGERRTSRTAMTAPGAGPGLLL